LRYLYAFTQKHKEEVQATTLSNSVPIRQSGGRKKDTISSPTNVLLPRVLAFSDEDGFVCV